MIYYAIRHKATQELMPQLARGKGYSHWNPAVTPTTEVFKGAKLVGVPRLVPSLRTARQIINQWNSTPNGRYTSHQSSAGDYDEVLDIKPDGRKKEDLEVIEVEILVHTKWLDVR